MKTLIGYRDTKLELLSLPTFKRREYSGVFIVLEILPRDPNFPSLAHFLNLSSNYFQVDRPCCKTFYSLLFFVTVFLK